MALIPSDFKCPMDMKWHVERIFQGEYDVPVQIPHPIILDIGANVGAFTVWASKRWPKSVIHAYEPIKHNFQYLIMNIDSLHCPTQIFAHNLAVLGKDLSRRRMHLGLHNLGESSFHNLGEQSNQLEKVRVVSARELPAADIVKIDTEGCEVEILEGLDLTGTSTIMLEYHGESDRKRILSILESRFSLLAVDCAIPARGTMKFVRKVSFRMI